MSTNKTENYGLHAGEAEDDFLREEMNENFAMLDAALGGMVTVGRYTGDGTKDRVIALGFTPRAVLIMPQDQHMNETYYSMGGLVLKDSPLIHGGKDRIAAIVEGGFQVSHFHYRYTNYSSTATCNPSGDVIHYAALR